MLPNRKQNKVKDIEIEELLEKFQPHINKALKNTSYQEREDLEQEIKIKILEKVSSLDIERSPGFWEFIRTNSRNRKG